MDEAKLAEFQKELTDLAKKYEIIDASFTGRTGERYIGILGLDNDSLSVFDAVVCVGRLWQHAREATRQVLNSYERDSR